MGTRSQSGSGRREFLGAAAAALFAGVTITLIGCGDDSATGTPAEAGGMTGDISDNHGHKAVITKAQLEAGGAVTLDIRGSAGHTHTVSLTAEDMAELKKPSGMVTKNSSTSNSHAHEVMFM